MLPALSSQEIDEATIRYLADNLPTLCWIARGDGYIVWYNRRWHEYCGTTPEEMEGWGWQSAHDPSQLPDVMAGWTHSISTGDPFEMTFPLRGADGVFRPFLTRVQPMRDASGKVVRWFGINTDITDQKRAEASLRAERDRSTGVLESMSEGLLLLDREFRVLDMNTEGLRVDGRTKDEIVGKLYWDAWPGSEQSEEGTLYQYVMRERLPISTEMHHVWPDGRAGWVAIRALPHPEGIAIFFREISAKKRKESELRDSEAFIRLLLDSSSDAIYAVDLEGRITLCNESFLRLLGFDNRDAVIGRNLHELHHHSHPDGSHYDQADCPIFLAASQGIRAVVENEVFFRADGTSLSVAYRAEPIMRDGQRQGAICTFNDITDRLKAEKRAALFQALKDRLHQLSSPVEIIQATVEMLGQHLGISRCGYGKVESDDQTMLFEIDYANGVDHLVGRFPIETFGRINIAALRQGETVAYADVVTDERTQDADWSVIQTRAAMGVPLVREGRLKAVLYLNHHAIRVWTRDEITLVQEVAARTWDALERAYAEENLRQIASDLSEVNRRKTEFIATLAHELRNPLAPLRTGLELIRRSTDKPDTVRRVHSMMERQIGNMVHLIDDLLDIARISSGKIELMREPVSLRQIVSGAVETSAPIIESKSHQLSIDLPAGNLLINADSVRLIQVLSNLLTNAAKYTPPNGALSLVGSRENNQVVITVRDNGIGIDQASLTKVFEMFTQVRQSSDRSQGGLGIGLSLAQRLVEMHEGTLVATSPGINKGSAFTVRLPLANADCERSIAPVDSQDRINVLQKKLRILVADDNIDAAEMLATLLQDAGHEVHIANDGLAAVRIATATQPEIAIVDIGMPGLNGYEVAMALRKEAATKKTVLVALTGWGSADDQVSSHNAGFDHHLTKPVRFDKVVEILVPLTER